MPRQNQQFRMNVPRRRIEKIWSRLANSIADTETTKILHTAEDVKTLIRTIIQLDLVHNIGVNPAAFSVRLVLAPAGTAIGSVGLTESLDNNDNGLVLWQHSGSFGGDVNSNEADSRQINVDLKGMRKMKVGDEIQLQWKGAVNGTGDINGIVTQFFKE